MCHLLPLDIGVWASLRKSSSNADVSAMTSFFFQILLIVGGSSTCSLHCYAHSNDIEKFDVAQKLLEFSGCLWIHLCRLRPLQHLPQWEKFQPNPCPVHESSKGFIRLASWQNFSFLLPLPPAAIITPLAKKTLHPASCAPFGEPWDGEGLV